METAKIESLYSLENTIAADIFDGKVYPWEILGDIHDFILGLGERLSKELFYSPSDGVWIAKDASVAATAVINGPAIICSGAEIRHCAYIRGAVIIGAGSVVGNSCELKNAILFDGVQVPHFNYVGDSVLGYKAHMGAGAITSNVKGDKSVVCVKGELEIIETGRKKVGTFLGDNVEIGCNCVLCPGSVVGRNTQVYPLSMVRGVIMADSIYKSEREIVKKMRGDRF